jgi:ABC-type polysaccharide/polyol phosphate export permease
VDAVLDANTEVVLPTRKSHALRARRDIIDGLKLYPVWGALAWHDIRIRYIRTMLGPLWITVSMGVTVLALGFVFSGVFKTELREYLPFLTAGLLIWGFISGVLTESALTFAHAITIIMSISAPYSMHIYRAVLKQFIIFGHNMLVFLVVALLAGVPMTWATLLFVPAILLVCIVLTWMNLLAALIGCRFRDLQPIVASLLQLVFFLTPLIWDRNVLPAGSNHLWIDANPFFQMIEIARAPLLGKVPPLFTVVYMVAMAVVGWSLTYLMFARFRRRIPYWL